MHRAILILLAFILSPAVAYGQTCSFGVTNANFGNVDTLSGAATDTTATVNISCSGALLGAQMRVCLNINAGSGGAASSIRQMRNATNAILTYQLYQDPARTTPWGSVEQTALGTPVALNLVLPIGGGSVSTSRTVYGRVLAGQQSVSAGAYSSVFSGAQTRFNYEVYLLLPPDCSSVASNHVRPTFNVLANVIANCSVTAQNINFGAHGVLTGNVDANGGLNVTCTPGAAYTVGLNGGLSNAPSTARRMTLGGQAVIYGLYKDQTRTQPWGNVGAELLAGTGAGAAQNLPVYGRVPSQPTPSPGTYTDTVVVTVTY